MTAMQRRAALIAARQVVSLLTSASSTQDGPAQDALVAQACASAVTVGTILQAPKPSPAAKEPA